MIFKRKIIPFFQAALLLSFCWLSFVGISIFLKHDNTDLSFSAPDDATSVFEIDGKQFFDQALYEIIILSRDQELGDALRAVLNFEPESDQNKEFLVGVDIFNSIVVFTTTYMNEPVTGYIFKLKNTKQWDKNASKLFSGNSFVKRDTNSGLLLHSNKLSKSQLKAYANEAFSKKAGSTKEQNSLVHYSLNGAKLNLRVFEKITGDLYLKNETINAKGHINFGKNHTINRLNFVLEPNGIHITNHISEPNLMSEIEHVLLEFNLSLPKFNAFSLNYDGIILRTKKSGVKPLPKIEVILQFDSITDIANLKQEIAKNKSVLISENGFSIAGMEYYLKQLDSKTIYIGINKAPQIHKNTTSEILLIKGKPSILMEIKGSKLVVGAVKMRLESELGPIMSFVEKLESCNLSVFEKNGEYNLEFKFLENKHALNESVKLFVNR